MIRNKILRMIVIAFVMFIVISVVDILTGARVVGGKYANLHDVALLMLGYYGFSWVFKN
ncbi:MAG: hypothetical protein M1334_03960 [Patescibacteria group bacterium]|nr:hypothetical protein [Patescibacteria group bacterium]